MNGFGIGEPHILYRHADQAARQVERVFSRHQHACEIIEGSIGIGAPHRLVQRGNQIVVAVLGLVVEGNPFLDDIRQSGRIEQLAVRVGGEQIFDQVDEIAPIAVGETDE